MGRAPRSAMGNIIYHAINRANGRVSIFQKDKDYEAFEQILVEAKKKFPIRILAYVLMPNHWHFILYPYHNEDLSDFLRWVTLTHTQRWHAHYHNVGYGHVYQGRFKSFPVEEDNYLIQLCRYVERNPLRAGLVEKAEDWKWSSLWKRLFGTEKEKELLDPWPVEASENYLQLVNNIEAEDTLFNIRTSINRGAPLGSMDWVKSISQLLGTEKVSGTFLFYVI